MLYFVFLEYVVCDFLCSEYLTRFFNFNSYFFVGMWGLVKPKSQTAPSQGCSWGRAKAYPSPTQQTGQVVLGPGLGILGLRPPIQSIKPGTDFSIILYFFWQFRTRLRIKYIRTKTTFSITIPYFLFFIFVAYSYLTKGKTSSGWAELWALYY